jgi:hypothetical protein
MDGAFGHLWIAVHKGTLPNITNGFCLGLHWRTRKLPVVCTRFGSLWKYFHKQRKRVLANGGLLKVHRWACKQAFVNFMFAAMAGIGLEPANDSSQLGSRRSVAETVEL